MTQIDLFAPKDVVKVLVAAKCDLENGEVQVISEEGKALAQTFQIKFFETSAKKNIQVKEPFYGIAQEIIDQEAAKMFATEVSDRDDSIGDTPGRTFSLDTAPIIQPKSSWCCSLS